VGDWFENMGDGMDISEAARDNYSRRDEQFREILALLMMFTCGLSGRGTEMTSLRWMNTMDGDRSIYIEDRQLMFVTEYHKSMALMDDQKVGANIYGLINYRLSQGFCHTESASCWDYILQTFFHFDF
jgi:hypothetical protein